VYVRAPWWIDGACYEPLRIHESVHLDQMDRDGTWTFCWRYVWWTLRHGYRGNPYEVEAYKISDAFMVDWLSGCEKSS
jgi:hypothetical protein